jgi:uncharacterized membrane protein YphA (DoxX/SURF4 family)
MENSARLGRPLFAIAMVCFGLQYLFHAWMAGPEPGPPWSPSHPLWAYATAVLLVVAGVGIATGKQARLAAGLLAMMLLLRALMVYAPRLAAHPHDPGPWTSGFEILAMGGVAMVLAGTAIGLGRLLFAISLVVFGVQHFLYARFISTLVPSWIPGHLFWAYFVGVAFVASALSVAARKHAGLAATLLGLMFFLWVISVHLPRVVASTHDGKEWTSMFVALAMCGGAWVMAGQRWLASRR